MTNKTIQKTLTRVLAIVILFINACDVTVDRPESSGAKFHRTFNGSIITTQDGQNFTDEIDLSFTVGSPLNGTFFRKGDGAVGTISGDATDVSARFTGTSIGYCPASFSGTMTIKDNNKLSVEMDGTDCYGQFKSTGVLAEIECIDISGNYDAEETATTTITIGGESETETFSGKQTLLLVQNACDVHFYVPGFNDIIRKGKLIEGRTLTFTGEFLVSLAGNVVITKNTFTAKGTISDEYDYSFEGLGIAEGTVDGIPFSVTGTSKGILKKCFDVAVAVLRGGIFGSFVADSDLDMIKNQAIRVDPKHVIAKGFKAHPGQLKDVGNWLDKINRNGNCPTKVILIGHSLGGDAVRRSNFSNMCSRITIDPINPDVIAVELLPYLFGPLPDLIGLPISLLESLDQRRLTFPILRREGEFTNILAETKRDLNGVKGLFLLGHHIVGATEPPVEANTNHFTVVPRVLISGIVSNKVRQCLSSGLNITATRAPFQQSLFYHTALNGKQLVEFRFGWQSNRSRSK